MPLPLRAVHHHRSPAVPEMNTCIYLRFCSKRWTGAIVFCVALVLFNLIGTMDHTLTKGIALRTSSLRKVSDNANNSSEEPLNKSTLVLTTEAVVNQSLHSLNYRIDPKRLRRDTANLSQWHVLEDYARLPPSTSSSRYSDIDFSATTICQDSPGRGIEREGGMKILNKLQIASDHGSHQSSRPVRLLCAIYTHPPMHPLARTAALTWGRRCDGFIAMSNQTVEQLNFLDLRHAGSESYANMWQKSRSIWFYIHRHYLREYDLFHLGGDDMYVIPENLKAKYTQVLHNITLYNMTTTKTTTNATNNVDDYWKYPPQPPPVYMGQWIPHGNSIFVAGGAGYTLNQAALRALVERALPYCHVNTTASFEDRLVTKCLRQVGVEAVDTRDPLTAEQTYHDVPPDNLYLTEQITPGRRGSFHARAAAYWEKLPHPTIPNTTVGPRRGLEAASSHSISFHHIHRPDYMVRLDVIIHRYCPSTTVLGEQLPTKE